MLKGIDISMHNRYINFNKVKKQGYSIILIKATEGINYTDPFLEHNYINAKKNDLNIGFYHFMSEKTSPGQQALDFWNSIKNKKFNIYPILDIETNSLSRKSTEITNRCLEFLEYFKRLSGLKCIIYTGAYFGKDELDNRIKKNYNGWIAHYGVNKPMENGFNIIGHQFTGTGRIDGVHGNVDLNKFYSDSIFINNKQDIQEELFDMENLVIYDNGLDKNSAEYLADFLSCPTIENSRLFNYSNTKNVFAIGGNQKNRTTYLKKGNILSGENSLCTFERVINFILSKLGGKETFTFELTDKEKDRDNKKLVIYNNMVDKRSAEYLAYKLNCSLKKNKNIDISKYDIVYLVGGGNIPKNVINIKGNDRYKTAKAIIDYMKLL